MTVSVLRKESAYKYHTQTRQHIHKHVTWETPNIQTTAGAIVYVGGIPANALKMDTIVRINTTFDGLLIVGTSSDTDAFATTADVAAGTAGTYITDTNAAGERTTVDLPVYVQLTTGSTVGDADVWVEFIPA